MSKGMMTGWVMWNLRWKTEIHSFLVVKPTGEDHLEVSVLGSNTELKQNLRE